MKQKKYFGLGVWVLGLFIFHAQTTVQGKEWKKLSLSGPVDAPSSALKREPEPKRRHLKSSKSKVTAKARRRRSVKRGIASYGESRSQVATRKSSSEITRYQLGIQGGFAKASIATTEQTANVASDPQTLPVYYLGVVGEANRRYYGAELDAYYLYGPGKNVPTTALDGTQSEIQHAISQFGALACAKLFYRVKTESVGVIPKVGLGYGIMFHKMSNKGIDAETGEEFSLDTKGTVHGVFGMIGMDVYPVRSFLLSFDLATSLFASGSVSSDADSNANSEEADQNSPSFSRIRLGGYYRLDPKTQLGGQFLIRGVNTGGVVEADSLKIFLVSVRFDF